jgi:hypothetical protein
VAHAGEACGLGPVCDQPEGLGESVGDDGGSAVAETLGRGPSVMVGLICEKMMRLLLELGWGPGRLGGSFLLRLTGASFFRRKGRYTRGIAHEWLRFAGRISVWSWLCL